jgi:hypothetical protein
MPYPDQDATLRSLVDGEAPDEVVFDPITDNDSTGSCLGCAYSVVGAAAVLVGLYAADARYQWGKVDQYLGWGGKAGVLLAFSIVVLTIFTVIEVCAPKEVYALDVETGRLDLRLRNRDRPPIKTWDSTQILRFTLDPPSDDAKAKSCLYVMIQGEEPIKLLEACYDREYVEQIERKISEICKVPSTT